MIAPRNDAGSCQRSRGPWPASSRRYPQVPDALPGTSPIALDIVAVTGGKPKATRVGKVISVPEPTTALIMPAPTPARKMATISTGLTLAIYGPPCLRRRAGRERPLGSERDWWWDGDAGSDLLKQTPC